MNYEYMPDFGQAESREAKIERMMTGINESRIKIELRQMAYEMRKSRIAASKKEKEIAKRELQEKRWPSEKWMGPYE